MRVSGTRMRKPARALLGAAPALREQSEPELREGQVRCPGCGRGANYRGAGKLAGTLVAHRVGAKQSDPQCLMGTPSCATGPMIVKIKLGNDD